MLSYIPFSLIIIFFGADFWVIQKFVDKDTKGCHPYKNVASTKNHHALEH